ncbi:MAG: glycosyltransferase family 2 protein [Bacteroidia bacterium]|nr:glycosyltransferase family 2 protein [Bacteroidia bacterium]
MNYPDVDIVVLNYNGRRFLDACFKSLQKSSYTKKHIFLLDNASTENDVDYVKEKYPWVGIIQNPKNNGYCAAYNLAFNSCKSPYMVCLNNDVEVNSNWLEPMIELMLSDPKIGAIQPKILDIKNPEYFEYAGASGGMIDKYAFPFMRGRIFTSLEKDNGQYNNVCEIFWASGAAMLVNKQAITEAGYLDEIIVHHMDEIDLCWRFQLHGYKILVQPKSTIWHVGGATIAAKSFKKTYWNHRNSIYMMIKNYESKNLFGRTFFHVLLDYVALAQALLSLQWQVAKGILYAHTWILKNYKNIRVERVKVQRNRKVGDDIIDQNMYQGSIVWAFFGKRIKTYKQLI